MPCEVHGEAGKGRVAVVCVYLMHVGRPRWDHESGRPRPAAAGADGDGAWLGRRLPGGAEECEHQPEQEGDGRRDQDHDDEEGAGAGHDRAEDDDE